LIKSNKVNLNKVKWLQSDDDIYSLSGHFEVFALLLNYKAKEMGGIQKAINALKGDIGSFVEKM
jgi:hypothetical protein